MKIAIWQKHSENSDKMDAVYRIFVLKWGECSLTVFAGRLHGGI